MLASAYRCTSLTVFPFILQHGATYLKRSYTQQRTARTARSALQQTTTNPSPTTKTKNRNLSPSPGSASHEKTKQVTTAPVVDDQSFVKMRQGELARELEQSGAQLEMLRMSLASGIDPWGGKSALMDLRIPSPLTSFRAVKENAKNNLANSLSMFRLATDFAFPGIVTRWRVNPQIFRAKSTSEKAWVAPFRHELLDVYKRVNQAIASGDKKALAKLTAYEFQSHAFALLQRNLARTQSTGHTYTWSLTRLLSPVKILSLRTFPLYTAPEEPRYGNRNVAQALVRFESLQALTPRDARGRVLLPNGSVAPEGYEPESRRVLEYLICENKMFYKDGWYVREHIFEGVKPRFKDVGSDL